MSSDVADIGFIGLNAVFVGSVEGGGPLRLLASRLDSSGNSVQTLLFETVANDGTLTRYERALPGTGGTGLTTLAQRHDLVKNRRLQLEIGNDGWGTYEVAFLGLRAVWEQEDRRRVQPPQRVFPRDDGLLGSARRNYPPPKSRQRSSRTYGGYL